MLLYWSINGKPGSRSRPSLHSNSYRYGYSLCYSDSSSKPDYFINGSRKHNFYTDPNKYTNDNSNLDKNTNTIHDADSNQNPIPFPLPNFIRNTHSNSNSG